MHTRDAGGSSLSSTRGGSLNGRFNRLLASQQDVPQDHSRHGLYDGIPDIASKERVGLLREAGNTLSQMELG
ncbi:hypothetical protein Tco_0453629 [Tanacetum coccineum]